MLLYIMFFFAINRAVSVETLTRPVELHGRAAAAKKPSAGNVRL